MFLMQQNHLVILLVKLLYTLPGTYLLFHSNSRADESNDVVNEHGCHRKSDTKSARWKRQLTTSLITCEMNCPLLILIRRTRGLGIPTILPEVFFSLSVSLSHNFEKAIRPNDAVHSKLAEILICQFCIHDF